jgi:hypothetical protein
MAKRVDYGTLYMCFCSIFCALRNRTKPDIGLKHGIHFGFHLQLRTKENITETILFCSVYVRVVKYQPWRLCSRYRWWVFGFLPWPVLWASHVGRYGGFLAIHHGPPSTTLVCVLITSLDFVIFLFIFLLEQATN